MTVEADPHGLTASATLLLKAGRLALPQVRSGPHAWLASKGGMRFAFALANGDVAGPETQSMRRAICRSCPARTRTAGPDETIPSDWCGKPLVETTDTCGCLLVAKTCVGSERCPRGLW